METIYSLEGLGAARSCALALGAFDGLHRGHMAVIGAALRAAETEGLVPSVFTFSQSPSGEGAVLTAGDKALILAWAGIARMYSLDFNALRGMEAGDFVEQMLFGTLNARHLCCGEDFRFGRGAKGDVALLRERCGQRGVGLTVMPPVSDGAGKISSTRIRRAVEAGDVALAGKLLGRPVGFEGEVIHGNHIGGTRLGTPTINQALPEGFVQPRFGVYAAWCLAGGGLFYGVCNIGVKPTVGSDVVLAETWMPDYSGDLYGQRVRLFLMDFIRPEKKFPSLEALREEIRRNGMAAREITAAASLPEQVRELYI